MSPYQYFLHLAIELCFKDRKIKHSSTHTNLQEPCTRGDCLEPWIRCFYNACRVLCPKESIDLLDPSWQGHSTTEFGDHAFYVNEVHGG